MLASKQDARNDNTRGPSFRPSVRPLWKQLALSPCTLPAPPTLFLRTTIAHSTQRSVGRCPAGRPSLV